jgi:CO dehydrogenase/acetyl-CoA synthase alpha subunit
VSRRVSNLDNVAVLAWTMNALKPLPKEPTNEELAAARRTLAIAMAHDKIAELKEYYLDELKDDDEDVRESARREMEDPIDLASYVSEQLEDRDEWNIEAETLLDSVLDEFNKIVK